jgi:hypothetical protein
MIRIRFHCHKKFWLFFCHFQCFIATHPYSHHISKTVSFSGEKMSETTKAKTVDLDELLERSSTKFTFSQTASLALLALIPNAALLFIYWRVYGVPLTISGDPISLVAALLSALVSAVALATSYQDYATFWHGIHQYTAKTIEQGKKEWRQSVLFGIWISNLLFAVIWFAIASNLFSGKIFGVPMATISLAFSGLCVNVTHQIASGMRESTILS